MNNKKYFKPQRAQRSQRMNYSLRSDSSEIPKRIISEFSVSSVAKQKEIKILSISVCILILSFLSGCGKNFQKPLPICPGKPDVTESLAVLKSQSQKAIPLFIRGKCSIEYYDNNEKHKQHLSIKVLLIKPPSEIYMQASAGVIEKAIVLGSNEKEFWLEAKPDQISSYWWGLWSQQNSADAGIMINPKTLLEALGIAEIDANADWSLSNEGAFDVLTKTVQNIIVKKIFIYCCDYRVSKIEYFDNRGKPTITVELKNYSEVQPGLFVPVSIAINSVSDNVEDTLNIDITLESVKPATDSQKKFDIDRTQPKGFDHVYQVINGQW